MRGRGGGQESRAEGVNEIHTHIESESEREGEAKGASRVVRAVLRSFICLMHRHAGSSYVVFVCAALTPHLPCFLECLKLVLPAADDERSKPALVFNHALQPV